MNIFKYRIIKQVNDGMKQVVAASAITWLLTIGGVVVAFAVLQENHSGRINTLETNVADMKVVDDVHTKGIALAREEAAGTVAVLHTLVASQQQSNKILESIQGSVRRLETIDEIRRSK